MQNTKIEWATKVWNVVTGCFNNCPYCYARQIAKRFGGHYSEILENMPEFKNANGTGASYLPPHYLKEPLQFKTDKGFRQASFPYGFEPTFHDYRLQEPFKHKRKENVFVCSMSDLFHNDIPIEWIYEIFNTTANANRHNYLFLTKNPMRYNEIFQKEYGSNHHRIEPQSNYWMGATITDITALRHYEIAMNYLQPEKLNCKFFASFEPLMQRLDLPKTKLDWVIIGTETGNRKNKIATLSEWVRDLYRQCVNRNIPVFLKNNLTGKVDFLVEGKPLTGLPQQMPVELLISKRTII